MSQDINVENVSKDDNTTSKINKKRLAWTFGLGGSSYVATSYSLYNNWYRDFPLTGFHTFNDLGEWRGVDKAGHMFSGYFQSNLAYQTWRWVGLEEKGAIWAGAATGFIAQTTIEVMDGFSENWGFSIPDMTANFIGIGSFVGQQMMWKEQRILFKTSSTPINYQKRYGTQIFQTRADELFGDNLPSRILKDYNAQTTWLSANIKSFFPESSLPKWLNLSVGYGAENLFGGFHNSFGDGSVAYDSIFKRYSQFYLSLDVDFSRIETDSAIIGTLLDILNIIKVPFSTLEINTLGQVKFHLIRF